MVYSYWDVRNREWLGKCDLDQIMEWVAHNLKECGFPTRSVGSSWGVLYDPSQVTVPREEMTQSVIEIIEANRPE